MHAQRTYTRKHALCDINTSTHAHARTHTHIQTHKHSYACTFTHANTHMLARTHMRTHTCTHSHIPTRIKTHAHTRIRTANTYSHTGTSTHRHVHTHTHARTHARTHINIRTSMLYQPLVPCMCVQLHQKAHKNRNSVIIFLPSAGHGAHRAHQAQIYLRARRQNGGRKQQDLRCLHPRKQASDDLAQPNKPPLSSSFSHLRIIPGHETRGMCWLQSMLGYLDQHV